MKILRNKIYTDLIDKHIRNPYKTMINGPIEYDKIPELIESNPEWAKCVFDRLSRIYTHMERSLFPNDKTAIAIIGHLSFRDVIFV